MWKSFLKHAAVFIMGFVSAFIIIFIVVRWGIYKMITSREGFQASNSGGSAESPATCAMMKLIIEKAQESVNRTEQLNDPTSLKLAKESLESIKKEMQSLNCP